MSAEIRASIQQLYAELSQKVDAGDVSGANLFVEDGVFAAPGTEIAGRQAIADYIASQTGATTRHCIVNLIVGEGDETNRKVSATGLIAVNRDGATATVVADYKGQIVKSGGAWLFKRHEVAPVIRVPGAAG